MFLQINNGGYKMMILLNQKLSPIRAEIHGGPLAPNIGGIVNFYNVPRGTEVCADISGLPKYQPASVTNGDPIGPHGFHIHEYSIIFRIKLQ